MGREIKRVPLDFAWPLHMRWKGYMNPYAYQQCDACDGTGYNPETKRIADNYYQGERWCNAITQDEVDALIERDRLMDFTHERVDGKWVAKENPIVTPEMVNRWNSDANYRRSIGGFLGHDAVNRWILIETRAKRLGVWGHCPACDGSGEIWFSDKIRELSEAWYENERYDPPTGEGWQVWEDTTEGSPISPVFATSQETIDWLVNEGYSREAARSFVEDQQWVPSMVLVPGRGIVCDIEGAGLAKDE